MSSFESRIVNFARRFLSRRSYELIVTPAVADLQFEEYTSRRQRAALQLAVLSAVAGAVRDDLARESGDFILLMLLPASYYIFLLLICFDFSSISLSTGFAATAGFIFVLSFAPVAACFWPDRRAARAIE